MVALADTTTLPPLSPEDQHLLERYIHHNENLTLLAAELASSPHLPIPPSPNLRSPLSLLLWSASPKIAPHISLYRSHITHLDKREGIEALKSLIRTTEDPVEKRRAATTLLRALANQLHPTKSRGQSGPSGASRRSTKPADDLIDETDEDLVDESDDAADDDQLDDPDPDNDTDDDSDDDSLPLPEGVARGEGAGSQAAAPKSPTTPSDSALSTPSSALPPPLSIPAAYSRGQLKTHPDLPLPDPLRKPEDVIHAALHAIQNPATPTYSSGPLTLYNLAGNIASRTEDHFENFMRTTLQNWFAGAWYFKSRSELSPIHNNRATVNITTRDGGDAQLHFELHRPESGTLANCWLLKQARCDHAPKPAEPDTNSS